MPRTFLRTPALFTIASLSRVAVARPVASTVSRLRSGGTRAAPETEHHRTRQQHSEQPHDRQQLCGTPDRLVDRVLDEWYDGVDSSHPFRRDGLEDDDAFPVDGVDQALGPRSELYDETG